VNQHVPEELLSAFVEGDLDDQLVIHIATHLDECPRCATRAAHLEPLAAAFAAVDDPMVPEDLVAAVLAATERRESWLSIEVILGAAMLLAASALVLVGTDPIGMLFDSFETLAALPRLGNLAAQVSMSAVGLLLAVILFTVGSGFAVRYSRRTT
jgi:anti-sigma factor RsiW